MNKTVLAVVAVGLLAASQSISTFGQICHVKTGVLDNGAPVYTDVYESDYVDNKPEFPGGSTGMLSFINSTRVYPVEAYQAGIEGRVTCSFVVFPDGKIGCIKVIRGVEPSLNDEAVRIISEMPDWTPGKFHDEAVPVRMVCCIPFRK